ncbi:MAG: PTS sugar transporter subunit IIA [Acidobacteriota bacterium]
MAKETEQALIGIVAVSHCQLAAEMLRVAELIVGRLPACKAVCFEPHQPVEDMVRQVQEAVAEVDMGGGVLILTDLFGGTPANISLSLLGPKIEVVCGMNLPMLIKLAGCRKSPLAQAAATVKEYGQRHISLASEVLARSAKAVS